MSDTWACPACRDKDAEIERLKARVAELEHSLALAMQADTVDLLDDFPGVVW